jgi:lysylphosphatidylglycerol synthetase-like protein (DUF2156 family)
MKTFDVSVNLLTDNVLSDKMLWIQNRDCTAPGQARELPKPPPKPPPKQPPCTGSEQPVTVALPTCSRTPNVPVDIAILLLLPGTFMFVFVMLMTSPKEDNSARDRISTLVACAILLSTPAVLTICNPRASGRRPLLLHMLLLHATALLTVIRPENIWAISAAWAAVFAHLSLQPPNRRWLCLLFGVLNVFNVTLLLMTREGARDLEASPWVGLSTELFSTAVILASCAGYAYCYIFLG